MRSSAKFVVLGSDEERKMFVEQMKKEFEMSMLGKMKYFLGLQIV